MARAAYWVVFAAALGVYLWMITGTLPAITRAAGGLMPFDLRPTGYSVDEARAFLGALSDSGRAVYLGPQHMLDLVYPALLAVVLIGAVRVLFQGAWLRAGLSGIILAGMVADYVENAVVAQLLRSSGEAPAGMIRLANGATMVKSGLTGLAMVAVLAGLGALTLRKWNRR
jgi:hypothetical protein